MGPNLSEEAQKIQLQNERAGAIRLILADVALPDMAAAIHAATGQTLADRMDTIDMHARLMAVVIALDDILKRIDPHAYPQGYHGPVLPGQPMLAQLSNIRGALSDMQDKLHRTLNTL